MIIRQQEYKSQRHILRGQNAFVRAELSELLFRDKAKSTLLSIDGALMSNGNMGITTIFKRHYHLPRERILEDTI